MTIPAAEPVRVDWFDPATTTSTLGVPRLPIFVTVLIHTHVDTFTSGVPDVLHVPVLSDGLLEAEDAEVHEDPAELPGTTPIDEGVVGLFTTIRGEGHLFIVRLEPDEVFGATRGRFAGHFGEFLSVRARGAHEIFFLFC